jgi:sugar transferase (PEP-CTERM/EpsH1 system associated)
MSEKIRVMHVLYYLSIGGLEQVVLNLIKNLDRRRYRPYVACLRETGGLKTELEEIGVSVIEFNRGDGLDLKLPFDFARVLRKEKITILHTHDLGPYLYGAIAAKLARVPVLVHTEHSYLTQNTKILKIAERVLSFFTDTIISDSLDVTRFLVKEQRINPDKIETIYNGIDLALFQPSSNGNSLKSMLGLPPESQVVGTVGRLVPVKDQRTLISAVASVVAADKNVHLVLVGDGPLRDELTELTRVLGIRGNVHFLGNRRDVQKILQIFDVFVLPSLSEGLSLSLLEAMACSRPVITTHVGGNLEIIDRPEVGVLIKPGDVATLAIEIRDLLDNPLSARKMGASARKQVEARFSLKKMAESYESIYERNLTYKKI